MLMNQEIFWKQIEKRFYLPASFFWLYALAARLVLALHTSTNGSLCKADVVLFEFV